jgi:osmoprotectant transport system ATP-binding protein
MVMGKNIESWNKIELRRSIGYVIQQGGLFPHLTVRQNMEFVLSLSGTSREIINERIASLG